MSTRAPGDLAGTVRWAVATYAPKPPFRLYAADRPEPYTVNDPLTLIDAAKRGGDPDFTYLVPAKARPVLILNNPAEEWQEVTALRLARFTKFDAARQARIRRQEEPLLFHLDPGRFRLPEENAAMVAALVTIHVDAISSRESLGVLNPNEMRVLGEGIIRYYGFDTRKLVEQALHKLAARQQERGR